ncbi:MAG: GntR family transcriptional regulator, partial [Clostridia bacterium]|nr:GntR family transcriptional regulator [Clostridia bacterium]
KREITMQLKYIEEEMQQRSMAARDWVFQVLRTDIIRGVLPGGMPLRQDEISAQLSVSHIPVREAFRQLDAQGLVRIYPNRGAVVTKLTRDELENAMDTRIILEMGAIRAAIPLMTEECIEKASEILAQCEVETDANKLEDLNLQFHLTLYEATGNTFLLQLIEQLHANVDRYIRPYYSAAEVSSQSRGEHYKLLDACRSGDSEFAAAILRTHLEKTKVLSLNSPILQA